MQFAKSRNVITPDVEAATDAEWKTASERAAVMERLIAHGAGPSGPVVQFANASSTDFAPLHGERDEEHQFGVQIPLRGWILDADTFKTRVNNFLDHSNIGDSSIYFPVTVDGALIRAWELTLRSPRLWHFGQAHLAFSNQIAEQRGAITGGLICYPIGDPACSAGFNYTPVDT
jgi:hypothetical protein